MTLQSCQMVLSLLPGQLIQNHKELIEEKEHWRKPELIREKEEITENCWSSRCSTHSKRSCNSLKISTRNPRLGSFICLTSLYIWSSNQRQNKTVPLNLTSSRILPNLISECSWYLNKIRVNICYWSYGWPSSHQQNVWDSNVRRYCIAKSMSWEATGKQWGFQKYYYSHSILLDNRVY